MFTQCATKLVPLLCEMVRNEIEVDVVCSALDMIADLLKTCKQGITNIPGHCEEVIQVPYLTKYFHTQYFTNFAGYFVKRLNFLTFSTQHF